MDQKNDCTLREPAQAEPPRAVEAPPAPRKRFRIEKIEERIAPKGGGNNASGTGNSTNNGNHGGGGVGSISGSSVSDSFTGSY